MEDVGWQIRGWDLNTCMFHANVNCIVIYQVAYIAERNTVDEETELCIEIDRRNNKMIPINVDNSNFKAEYLNTFLQLHQCI